MPIFGLGRNEDDTEKELNEEGEEEAKTRRLGRRRPGQRKGRQDDTKEGEDDGEETDEQEEKKSGHRCSGRHCSPHRRPAGTNQRDKEDEEVDDEDEEGGEKIVVNEGESIQDALDMAQPGTTIIIGPGVYHEALKSRVDGTKEKPIILTGARGGRLPIVKGAHGRAACVEINHDYYILQHFWIDGTIKEHCHAHEVRHAYREKCLAIRGARPPRHMETERGDEYMSSVQGVVVRYMKISNCGGEGILVRYFATNCKIFRCKIVSTGCFDFKFEGDRGIKNGEGIYIGTSSTQWHKNPTDGPDVCRWTRVLNNFIDTQGNECVDVKEGALDTIIESNFCTGQLDEDSGGIDSRADRSLIRYNKVVGCKGAGIRLGGHRVRDVQYGIHCKVYGNVLLDNEFCGVKIMSRPHQIFQNHISGGGDDYKIFRGKFVDEFDDDAEPPVEVKEQKDLEDTAWFQRLRDL